MRGSKKSTRTREESRRVLDDHQKWVEHLKWLGVKVEKPAYNRRRSVSA